MALIFHSISLFYFFGMFFFIIFTTISIYYKLKKIKKNFDLKILKLQKKINRILFTQVKFLYKKFIQKKLT